MIASLHVQELVLARACSAGNAAAWDEFLTQFKRALPSMAVQITRDDAAGHDLADELYAELYGMPNRDGKRVSKLNYYMGRGSLQGWLRTVMAQKHVDRCRKQSRNVSLEEQVEAGAHFAAKEEVPVVPEVARVARSIEQALSDIEQRGPFFGRILLPGSAEAWRRSDGNWACMSRPSAGSWIVRQRGCASK